MATRVIKYVQDIKLTKNKNLVVDRPGSESSFQSVNEISSNGKYILYYLLTLKVVKVIKVKALCAKIPLTYVYI